MSERANKPGAVNPKMPASEGGRYKATAGARPHKARVQDDTFRIRSRYLVLRWGCRRRLLVRVGLWRWLIRGRLRRIWCGCRLSRRRLTRLLSRGRGWRGLWFGLRSYRSSTTTTGATSIGFAASRVDGSVLAEWKTYATRCDQNEKFGIAVGICVAAEQIANRGDLRKTRQAGNGLGFLFFKQATEDGRFIFLYTNHLRQAAISDYWNPVYAGAGKSFDLHLEL